MNLETKITIYKFTPQVFTLTRFLYRKVWGIERSGFFNDRGKWAKGFENQRV